MDHYRPKNRSSPTNPAGYPTSFSAFDPIKTPMRRNSSSKFCNLPIIGCERCNDTGYRGRIVTSEFLSLKDSARADQILDTKDSRVIYRIAIENGMVSLWARAIELVRDGITSPAEVRRVLGMSMRV